MISDGHGIRFMIDADGKTVLLSNNERDIQSGRIFETNFQNFARRITEPNYARQLEINRFPLPEMAFLWPKLTYLIKISEIYRKNFKKLQF